MSRLETIDRRLQARIIALDEARQAQLAFNAAEMAAVRAGIATLPDVASVLRGSRTDTVAEDASAKLEQLVGHLDEVAWEFQDQGDEEAYISAFSQARAANAVLNFVQLAGQERVLDVCYEAYAAIGSIDGIASIVDGME